MKKILLVVLILIILFGLGYYAMRNDDDNRVINDPVIEDVNEEEEEEEDVVTIPIKLYYYNPDLDQGQGGILCSSKGLVAVDRVLPDTTTPLAESIKLLLRGELTQAERAEGIETEFPLEGVTLENATISNGVATLTFNDPNNKTGGGSCRVGILLLQIEATAKQFPTVTSVRISPADLFQP
ncbi:MAG: GerMN domain-containing protein [Candidatus Paceibacterota bacterium]